MLGGEGGFSKGSDGGVEVGCFVDVLIRIEVYAALRLDCQDFLSQLGNGFVLCKSSNDPLTHKEIKGKTNCNDGHWHELSWANSCYGSIILSQYSPHA